MASAGRATGAAKALARAKAKSGGGNCGTGAGGFKTHNTCGGGGGGHAPTRGTAAARAATAAAIRERLARIPIGASESRWKFVASVRKARATRKGRGTAEQRSTLAGQLREARAQAKGHAARVRPGDVGGARQAARARAELADRARAMRAARAGRKAPDPIVKGRSREIPVKGDLSLDPRYGQLKAHVERAAVAKSGGGRAGVRLDRDHELVVDHPRTKKERALVERAGKLGALVVETKSVAHHEVRQDGGETRHFVAGRHVATSYGEPRADGRYVTRERRWGGGDDWREDAHDTRKAADRWARSHAAGEVEANSHATLDVLGRPRHYAAEDRIGDEHSRTTIRILHRG